MNVIFDRKDGQRAFEKIKEIFNTKWIFIPDITPTVKIDAKT